MPIAIDLNLKEELKQAILEALPAIIEATTPKVDIKDLYRVISREEVAKLIGVERPETVDKLARNGKIRYIFRNGKKVYRVIDALEYNGANIAKLLKAFENQKSG